MATATPARAPGASSSSANLVDQFVADKIAETCRALWWEELIRRTLILVIALICVVLVWVVMDQWIYSPGLAVRLSVFAAALGGAVWYLLVRIRPVLTSRVRPEYAARAIERDMPDLKQALTSYVTLRDQPDCDEVGGLSTNPASSKLQERIVRSIGSIAATRLRDHDALPSEATATLKWWIVAAASLAILMGYTVFSPKSTVASASRLLVPFAEIEPAKRVHVTDVQPGDVEAIAGRGVAVTAKVDGLRGDEKVWCRWKSSSRDHEFEMAWDEESGRFSGDLLLSHSDSGKIPYSVIAGDSESSVYQLSVKNLPVVAIESVQYKPPAYTAEIPYTSSSAAITAIDGTQVTITAKTNRAVTRADIEFNPRQVGQTVRATAGMKSMQIDPSGTKLSITFPLRSEQSRSSSVSLEDYRIRVQDEAGQDNPQPIVYPIRVIADLPPEVSIVVPRKSPKSMGVELQQLIEVHAMDPDFGLRQVQLKITRGIDVIKDPILWSSDQAGATGGDGDRTNGAKGNQVAEYRFRPSEHGLRVGDVVQITAIATDNRIDADDPSVLPNTSVTDPVEIRIVDDQSAPDPQGGDDGLSEADQQPASDHPQDKAGDQKSAAQQGDQKQGGSGGKGESGQQQQGDGGSQAGEGQSGDDQSGEGQDAQKQDAQEQSGGGGSNQNGEPSGNDSQAGEGGAEGTSSDGDSSTPQNAAAKDSQEKPMPSGDAPKDQNAGESGAGNSQGAAENSGSEDNAADGNAGEAMQPGDNDANGQPSKDAAGDPSQGDTKEGASDGPPKHDGRAFEKIRDYLEKKKKEQDATPDQKDGKQDGGEQNSDSSQGKSNSDSKPEEEGSKPPSGQPDANGKQEPGSQDAAGQDAAGQDAAGQDSANSQQGSSGDPKMPQNGADESQGNGGQKPDNRNGSEGGAQPNTDPQGKPSGDGSEAMKDDTSSKQSRKDQGDSGSPSENQSDQGDAGSKPKPSESGQDPMGDPSGENQDAGDSGTGDSGADDQSKNDANKPSPDGSPDGSEEQGDRSADDERQGDSATQDKPTPQGKSDSAGESSAQGRSSEQPGEQSAGQPGQQENDRESDAQQGGASAKGGKPSQQDSSNRSKQGGDSSSPSGADAGSGDAGDGIPVPEAADLEYTKKATDMVLDYLEETRDAPDRELLEELDWSEQDLKRFADRWKKTREMDLPGDDPTGESKNIRDALESLGLRPPADQNLDVRRDAADDLRGLRDSGNRRPAPAAYKDLFNSFRRGLGRQK